MPVSPEYEAWVLDQLAQAGVRARARRMFGGVGIFSDDRMFALIGRDSGQLFFKVGPSNQPDYETAGTEPFRPFAGRDSTMGYWGVPEDVVEDPDALAEWARKAIAAASAARPVARRKPRATKPKSKPKAPARKKPPARKR